MRDDHNNAKLLRSIRNALWLIASILLIQMGFHLEDFRRTDFAELVMLLGLWGGFFLFVITITRCLTDPFSLPGNKNSQAEQDSTFDGDRPPN